jgi:hypothetical protein
MSEGRLFHNPLDKMEDIGCDSVGQLIEWAAGMVAYLRDLQEITDAQRGCLYTAWDHLQAAQHFVGQAERLREVNDQAEEVRVKS